MTPEDIHSAILGERARQQSMYGGVHSWGIGDCSGHGVTDAVKAAVLAEECGEAARCALDRDKDGLRAELVQVAAVAWAWLEAL